MSNVRVVIATPHARFDALEAALRRRGDLQVERVRSAEELTSARVAQLAPTYVFFPQWSWKIPASVYEAFECVIFHMTDVPFGRGGSPLQNLIVRGFDRTKLTALRCEAGLDSGPVYLKTPLSLEGTAEEILARAATLMEAMILQIVDERPIPVPQEGEVVEFRRRTPADGNLNTVASLKGAYDHIRMLDGAGYPPAFLDVGPLRFEFADARRGDGYVDARVHIREKQDD